MISLPLSVFQLPAGKIIGSEYLTSSSLSETETGEKTTKEEAVVENTTPDYAAGLVSTQVTPALLLCPLLSHTLSYQTNHLKMILRNWDH